ncbi:odorant receptor 49a-like [Haematobia irritans]|uniref:odorant receptor 49a-like n=1 Tax=Haematobia irritans TaxID=7368 RepID=UPI003F50C90C
MTYIVRLKAFTEEKDFTDFCNLPNRLMKIYGKDFQGTPRKIWQNWLIRIYSAISFLCQMYCFYFICREVYRFMMIGIPDLALFLRLLSGFMYALFGTLKFIVFQWHISDMESLTLRLKEIYPATSKERRLYRVDEHFWPKWILVIVYLYFGAVTFISLSPLLEGIILYLLSSIRMGFGNAEFGYYKLYDILYSFEHRKPFAYLLTYTIEIFHAQFIIICNVCPDIWLLCFIIQLCMHFDYLVRTMSDYEPNENSFAKDNRFIAEFVKKHQILLDIGNDVNRTFGLLLLLLLTSTAAIICCAGIYTLTQGLGRELLEYCAFLPCAIGQYYLICHYGQQLAIISENIAVAAYNHTWYNGSQSYKKSILLIMMRAQKALQLNAYGFRPICLEAFQAIMGESYRLFALLKQTMFD